MRFLRYLLYPFTLLYWIGVKLRNVFYDQGWFKSTKFIKPVISVGNIEVGGTGKTPMIEYLVRLLSDSDASSRIATLSRGYGRKTKGFILSSEEDTARTIGDEPYQIRRKFPNIAVAVCENRVKGISYLKDNQDVIILDDAFQHRSITPGLSILLMDYSTVGRCSALLPAGNLREPLKEMRRADMLVITKAPKIFSPLEQRVVEAKIRPYFNGEIFYSYIHYDELSPVFPLPNGIESMRLGNLNRKTEVILLTGIAKPKYLFNFIEQYTKNITHFNFPDHYRFKKKDLQKVIDKYLAIQVNALITSNKIIITTEKDAMRLQTQEFKELFKDTPVYYLPMKADICTRFKDRFNDCILKFAIQDRQKI